MAQTRHAISCWLENASIRHWTQETLQSLHNTEQTHLKDGMIVDTSAVEVDGAFLHLQGANFGKEQELVYCKAGSAKPNDHL